MFDSELPNYSCVLLAFSIKLFLFRLKIKHFLKIVSMAIPIWKISKKWQNFIIEKYILQRRAQI